MFLRSLILVFSLLTIGNTQRYEYGVDVESLTRRDADGPILVGRLPSRPNGTIPRRLEIRQMRKDPYKWDLLVLALSMFQYRSQSDPMSWYQVAGIHGVPFQSWNGVEATPGAEHSGYCPHSSVLFPIWHRPYLALVEQEVFRMANFIASLFTNTTDRELYQRAAAEIRFPYWDWSIPAPPGDSHFPDVFWSPTIMQYGPRGIQSIKNPFYAYSFDPIDEEALVWSPLRSWPETKRAPATNISLTAPPSMNEEVNKALLDKLSEIQQRLYIIFSSYKDFNSFGNKAWAVSQNLTSWDSIEAVHDIIHIYGGLKGHMTYVPLSAFDPLFFIHHVSTDRLIAMWQIINPEAWIAPMPAVETSYNTLRGAIQTSQTELTPFHINRDTFWNSDMARTTEIFGYTYADTDSHERVIEEVRGELLRKVNVWWGSPSTGEIQPNNGPFNLKNNKEVGEEQYQEWVANVHANVEAMNNSYVIRFSLGEGPDNCEWARGSTDIGSVGMFGMNHMSGSKAKISGALPLTAALNDMVTEGTLPHLDPEMVREFLRQNLRFHICDIDDENVDPGTVEGLFVGISSANVTLPGDEGELPHWGTSTIRLQFWP